MTMDDSIQCKCMLLERHFALYVTCSRYSKNVCRSQGYVSCIYLFFFVLSSSAAASLLLFPVMPVAFRLPTNQTLAPTVQAMKNKFLLDGKKQNIASKYIFSIPETKSYQSEMLCHFLFIIFIFSIAPLYSHGLQSTVFIHYLTVQDSFSRAITTGLLQCISQCSLRFHVGTLYITAPLQLIVFAPSYCVESGFLM